MKTMKIALLVILTLFLLTSAQTNAQVKMEKGVKIGLNSAGFRGGDSNIWDSKTGFTAGFFLRHIISPDITVQPEFLYSAKGAERRDGTAKITAKLSFIEIPVLFRYEIPTQGNFKPALLVGPAIGFTSTSRRKEVDGGVTEEADVDNSKSSGVAFLFGGSADIQTSNFVVVLDLRYSMGLSQNYKQPAPSDNLVIDDPNGNAPDLKNRSLSFSLGILF